MTGAIDKGDERPDKWHVTLIEMTDAVTAAFASNGKTLTQAKADAETAVRAIYTTFRGSQVYIPLARCTENGLRNARIFDEFDGTNVRELSHRYEMSIQAIYRIVKKQREINRIARGEDND